MQGYEGFRKVRNCTKTIRVYIGMTNSIIGSIVCPRSVPSPQPLNRGIENPHTIDVVMYRIFKQIAVVQKTLVNFLSRNVSSTRLTPLHTMVRQAIPKTCNWYRQRLGSQSAQCFVGTPDNSCWGPVEWCDPLQEGPRKTDYFHHKTL